MRASCSWYAPGGRAEKLERSPRVGRGTPRALKKRARDGDDRIREGVARGGQDAALDRAGDRLRAGRNGCRHHQTDSTEPTADSHGCLRCFTSELRWRVGLPALVRSL